LPVIEVSWSDLEGLLELSLSEDEVEKYLAMLKCELEEIIDDSIFYEATHDRPDLFSVEGLARALKGLLNVELGLRKFNVNVKEDVLLEASGPSYRPYVLGAVVKNLRLTSEAVKQLMNLQEKLHVTYCRNRRKVSIGVYDLDTIKPPIYYREVEPDGIKFTPLDEFSEMTPKEILRMTEKGRIYAHLIESYPVYPILIDSQNRVLSLPPIINSDETRVTEHTENVFIDVTGTDLRLMMKVLTVIVTNVAERGSPEEIVPVRVSFKDGTVIMSPDLRVKGYDLSKDDVEKISGLRLSHEDIAHYLMMMRHDAKPESDGVKVLVSPYRVDILHKVDLVEDVLMAYGYENIVPETLPPTHSGKLSPEEYVSEKVKDVFIGLGFQEVANYMMSCPEILVHKMRLKNVKLVEVANPKMERYTTLRQWLLPGLLNVVSLNKRLGFPLKVFEVGDVVIVDESKDVRVKVERHVACALSSQEITMTDGLVICKAVFKTLNLDYRLEEEYHPSFIEGRCAKVIVNSKVVGLLGEFHPEVLSNFEIPLPTVGIEINLSGLMDVLLK